MLLFKPALKALNPLNIGLWQGQATMSDVGRVLMAMASEPRATPYVPAMKF